MMLLGEDLVIPAGTQFQCVDGLKREYCGDHYEALIELTSGLTASVVLPREAFYRKVTEADIDKLIELLREE